jgi:hypothetical protein
MSIMSYDANFMRLARCALADLTPGADLSAFDDLQVVEMLARLPPTPRLGAVATLQFDGRVLRWSGSTTHSWPAVSGKRGYQSKEHQTLKDKGPIPEGRWLVKQSRYQQISLDRIMWLERLCLIGIRFGTWPGGVSSWGMHRIWLEPASGTDTLGRSGFSIHGGAEPGSIGCIDLTGNMSAFVQVFRAYGKDVELTVDYL